MKTKHIKKIILILVVTTTLGVIIANAMNEELFNPKFSRHMVLTQISDVHRTDIFEAMADVEKYPIILPKNISEITIINRTNNLIFAEEVISEHGIEIKLLVKHEIFPPEKQTIEILNGFAKGTKIAITFYEVGSTTTISSDVSLITSGPASITNFMSVSNFESAYSTVIRSFEDYLKKENLS